MRTPERDFKNEDILQRETEIKVFTRLLENAKGPYVISIDAPWGTGKTYFTKILNSRLEDKFKTIYINAWESDYTSDPLLILVSELKEILPKKNFNRIADDFIRFSKVILPSAIKIASHGIIDTEKIASGISEVGEKLLEKKINDYQSEKVSIKNFKKELREAALSTDKKKIIVFIDELDRCRPDYAIEFIERVKHFFDLEGYLFILSIDESQLLESIKGNYGQNFDSEKYLRRFIDYKYSLKSGISKSFIEDSIERIGLREFANKKGGLGNQAIVSTVNFLSYLSGLLDTPARDIDQIISKLNIRLHSIDESRDVIQFEVQLLLVFLRHINKPLYVKYIEREVPPEDVLNELRLLEDRFDDYGYYKKLNTYITALILLQLRGQSLESDFLNKLIELRNDTDLIEDREREYAMRVLNVLEMYDTHTFDYVLRQFEQTEL